MHRASCPDADATVKRDAAELTRQTRRRRCYDQGVLAVWLMLSSLAFAVPGMAQTDLDYLPGSCAEIAGKFTASGQHADILRNDFLQGYKGKWVRWSGTVHHLSETLWGMEMRVQCLAGSLSKNVTVSFEASWKSRLAQLSIGQRVQFTGQLDDLSELGGISVKQGELGSSRVATAPPPASPGASRLAPPPQAPTLPPLPGVTPPAPPSPSPGSAGSSGSIPDVKVGDTYMVESLYPDTPNLSTITERKVLAVGEGKITVAVKSLKSTTGKSRTLQFTPEWNLLSSRNADGSGFDYSPPLQYFAFPLYPGKTWQQTSRETNIKTGAIREHTLSATVGDWEEVTVSAGTFRAIKITIRTELFDRSTEQKSTGIDISWYAPKMRRSVKSVITSRNFQGQEERQFIAITQYDLK